MKRAWYLHLDQDKVADAAILVGDRSRVRLLQELMTDVQVMNEDRGLLTVTGTFNHQRVVVVAFGMGAPIASVVAHELVDLGVTRLMRLGTMINLGETKLGDFIVADCANTSDGTSATYLPNTRSYEASPRLVRAGVEAFKAHGVEPVVGRAMTVDGFYTEMMPLDAEDSFDIKSKYAEYVRNGCVGLDMESAALFALGQRMGVDVGSMCIATVNGLSKAKMEQDQRVQAERVLSQCGLEAITKD